MIKSKAHFMITKARTELIRVQPFFGTLALRLQLVELDHPALPVMGTDGKGLFYNPSAVEKMPQPEVLGVVAHEVLHCAFQHMFRRKHRDKEKWNRACDYAINSIILKERWSLPPSRLANSKYDGMSAEEIYQKLPPDPSGDGESGDQGDWNFGASLDPTSPSPETGDSKTVSESQSISKDWEIATKQAAHLAKQAGNLPGYLETLVGELLQPQIPWRQQLWHFFSKRKPDRVTWNRPNRRLIAQGTYLPSKRFVPTGDIVVAVDTSGSISEDELRHFASEMAEIHRTLRPEKLWVLDIDTEIHRVKEYSPYDQLDIKYYGRGGTDFDPVFNWIRENNINPDAVVYLTDGYASWPDPVYDYPVCWCISNRDIKPPWGTHIILDI